VTTAADRRRRPCALALGCLVALLGVLALAPRAGAQACLLDPECTSSTVDGTTSTSDFSQDTSTTDQSVSRETSTTRRRTTTTNEATTTTVRSVTVSTVNDLLVPGDGTKGAESTTTTTAKLATGKSGLSDDQLIVLMVGGLGAVALIVSVLLWRYWWATRPALAQRR
jgi:cobalamin biosynthesis Mg chelatase CobN